jgi:hypothetical protein
VKDYWIYSKFDKEKVFVNEKKGSRIKSFIELLILKNSSVEWDVNIVSFISFLQERLEKSDFLVFEKKNHQFFLKKKN